MLSVLLSLGVALLLVSCGEEQQRPPAGGQPETPQIEEKGESTMKLTSEAFEDGQSIPQKYTGEGANVSPPLSWSDAPEGTQEFALICDDPDAPREEPWVHWVLWDIPADTTSLPEDSAGGGTEGTNRSGDTGYTGPMPPPGHGTHHYHFKLYALDTDIQLNAGATKKDLLQTIQDHVLAKTELVGTCRHL